MTGSLSCLAAVREHICSTPSFKTTLRDVGDIWPDIWSECRRIGLVRCLPDLALGLVVTVGMLLLALFAHVWKLVDHTILPIIDPWSLYHEGRREYRRREKEFARRFLARRDAVTVCARSRRASRKKSDLFFDRLPAEIRRLILIEAFGHRTLHMNLEFQHPFHLVDAKSDDLSNTHAGIEYSAVASADGSMTGPPSHLLTSEARQWTWFGCVCHRIPPTCSALSYGRRRSWPIGHGIASEPNGDCCLEGAGTCNEWPGEWPGKCQIGALGWLLSCRQAYLEGMDVLYRTNTIHIASAPLLHYLPDIMTPNVLSHITSLELVWNANQVPLALGFTGQAASKSHKRQTEPLFPSLQVLRITFASLTWGELDAATGLNWPYRSKDTLASRLETRLFPDIDALLDRIVPPSTDVTISCPKWIWYEVTDLALVEKQGKEATRPQRADIEGLKCWRKTPSTATGGDKGLEEASGSPFRAGFWIHIPVEDVNLGTGRNYDWKRDQLYGLEQVRFRYPVT
ncbi:unnamed protein product [Clonostachys rosea f. rosea IK726]|uniref:DUF7730 domain-containing protein n=2 Tax=Bionectria ochroleuca TaxID=29856 RepID=A0A0B7JQ97_BIOOC|nr:unnamed protein product [Clonostachys rosea f. rosea IK726]